MFNFFKKMGELPIPIDVCQNPTAFEMVRVWCLDNKAYISVNIGVWEDPAAYGILLADLAQHIANAYFEKDGRNNSEALRRVLEGLNAEIQFPTDLPEGEILNS